MSEHWLADRTRSFDASGIRKVFDLAAKLPDPINFSIGQPDFDVPEPVRQAAIDAIQSRKNGYALSQGMPVLREKLLARVQQEYGHPDRDLFVTSGTSGGLMLALMVLLNPGDEVVIFDPFFVMYDALAKVLGARVVYVDTYPDFRIDPERVAAVLTPRTKLILLNSPANPTGTVAGEDEVRGLAELAARRNVRALERRNLSRVLLRWPLRIAGPLQPAGVGDRRFQQDLRDAGLAAGVRPRPVGDHPRDDQAAAVQFRLRPQPAQWAGAAALDVDMSPQVAAYRRKRDLVLAGLRDDYELVQPGGAFYAFPRLPWGTGMEFVGRAIERYQLLMIPGNVFSRRDTHFRISYAAPDAVIARGVEALRTLAREGLRA